jgi:excisionase family DNA binding protein
MTHMKTPNPKPKPSPTGTVTVTEAMKIMGMARETIHAHIKTGTIPAKRLGKRILISREWLDNWFERLPDARTK